MALLEVAMVRMALEVVRRAEVDQYLGLRSLVNSPCCKRLSVNGKFILPEPIVMCTELNPFSYESLLAPVLHHPRLDILFYRTVTKQMCRAFR